MQNIYFKTLKYTKTTFFYTKIGRAKQPIFVGQATKQFCDWLGTKEMNT